MQLFNPLMYGQVTRTEAAQHNAPYTRNAPNKELRQYVIEKFAIPDDDFHFEEGNDDWVNVISNKNEVVNTGGKTWT